MTQKEIKPLSSFHTKVLLKMLNQRRALESDFEKNCDCLDFGDYFWSTEKNLYNDEHVYYYSARDIKAELAKRPHIPNKKESKLIRQMAAKKDLTKGNK